MSALKDNLINIFVSQNPCYGNFSSPEERRGDSRYEAAEVDGGIEHGEVGGHLGPLLRDLGTKEAITC
jgi:hypothetical protein